MQTYKIIQAVQDNGPNYFLIFEGVKVFGATPIAQCATREEAEDLVSKLRLLEELREERS